LDDEEGEEFLHLEEEPDEVETLAPLAAGV
jgi:hypothetical protein